MIKSFAAPNWKDNAAYPITKATEPKRWAWEFLRRNQRYQADWKQFADAVLAKANEHPETLKYAVWFLTGTDEAWEEFKTQFTTQEDQDRAYLQYGNTIFDWQDGPLLAYDPPIESGENIATYKQRVRKWTRYALESYLGEKWGLDSIQNPCSVRMGIRSGVHFKDARGSGWSIPNIDFRGDLNRFDANPIRHFSREEYATTLIQGLGTRLGRPELETITFNLSLPIDDQLDQVRAYLRAQARIRSAAREITMIPQPRYEARMYQDYLRAFDGKQAGATPAEIVGVLLPKEVKTNNAAHNYTANSKVKMWIKQASILVETGYRFIPLVANKAAKAKQKKRLNN